MQVLEESESKSGSTLNLSSGKSYSTMENSKLVLVAVIVIACCSIVAVVLAAVALTKSNDTPNINVGTMPSGSSASGAAASPVVISTGGSGAMGGSAGSGGQRTFTVAIGHDWGAHNYFDEEGYITGFSKELIEAVCEAAGVDCRTVWDKWNNCWDSTAGEHSMGGKGLYSRWYDGCMGWSKSVNRMQTFAFGTAYLARIPSHFYIKKGGSFNPDDIRGKKIDGWVSDEKCIARQNSITGNRLTLDQIIHIADLSVAVDFVKNGSADAVVTTEDGLGSYVKNNELDRKGEFYCLLSGSSMMTRKDSDFLTYWNQGFAKIQSSGKFKKLCADANTNHGDQGKINCV